MDAETRARVKQILIERLDEFTYKPDLAKAVLEGFIFGQYDTDKHYMVDEYWEIILEIEAEKQTE